MVRYGNRGRISGLGMVKNLSTHVADWESLRIRQPCYHACEMKVGKRKFDDALTKMLRAKPEPRKKIKTQGRRGPKTPILAKP